MAAVDSPVVFAARLKELGLEEFKTSFEDKGWTTFAAFAFSTSSFRQPEGDEFLKEVIEPLIGASDHKLVPQIRRLFMQAYAVTAADMERFTAPSSTP